MLNGLITRNFLYEEKIEVERIKMFAKNKILRLLEEENKSITHL